MQPGNSVGAKLPERFVLELRVEGDADPGSEAAALLSIKVNGQEQGCSVPDMPTALGLAAKMAHDLRVKFGQARAAAGAKKIVAPGDPGFRAPFNIPPRS